MYEVSELLISSRRPSAQHGRERAGRERDKNVPRKKAPPKPEPASTNCGSRSAAVASPSNLQHMVRMMSRPTCFESLFKPKSLRSVPIKGTPFRTCCAQIEALEYLCPGVLVAANCEHRHKGVSKCFARGPCDSSPVGVLLVSMSRRDVWVRGTHL